ncbi:pyrroloquinoline quinone precursor peptide PqqA [Actinomadura litoris]|nr:pyrroloquinoline quinone precursor peptide PqqA [Actinomadura litoris]
MENTTETEHERTATTVWATPDYQVVETSLEVTAYFGAEI